MCRDLHCRRQHYTWTSHPALEGTRCGPGRWCRAGDCQPQAGIAQSNALQAGWSEWSEAECDSSW